MRIACALLALAMAGSGCADSDNEEADDVVQMPTEDGNSGAAVPPPRLLEVSVEEPEAVAGQLINAMVRVENPSDLTLGALSISLLFDVEGEDVSASFVVTSDPDAPPPGPASIASLAFRVRIDERFAGGTVRVDALAVGTDARGNDFAVNGADTTALLPVIAITTLMVTTTEDENTLGASRALADAGETLSLREAILLANSGDPPVLIDYDEGLEGSSLQLSSALPSLTANQVIVDGRGMEVIGSSTGDEDYEWLIVGDDVIVRGLSLTGFSRDGLGCLGTSPESDRLLLDQVAFTNCAGSGAAVVIDGGFGHSLSRCDFSGERALRSVASEGLAIQDSEFRGSDAVEVIDGRATELVDNSFTTDVGRAILLRSGDFSVLRNTIATQTVDAEPAIRVSGMSTGIIADNEFSGSRQADVLVDADVTAVDVRDNIHSTTTVPVRTELESFSRPEFTRFDGESVTGSTAGAGRLDILVARSDQQQWELVSRISHPGGEFNANIPAPRALAVTALLTDSDGRTGAAAAPLSFPQTLEVSVLEDELDGDPQTLNGVAEAGGAEDLSLREALLIASNLPGVQTVTMSDLLSADAVLAPAEALVVTGDLILQHLTIDGAVIAQPSGPLLSVSDADAVVVESVKIQNTRGLAMHLRSRMSTRIIDSTVSDAGSGIRAIGGATQLIKNTTFSGIDETALELNGGLETTAQDNRFAQVRQGVFIGADAGQARVVGNLLFDTGFAISIDGRVENALVAFNTIDGATETGIQILPSDNESHRITSNIVVRAVVALAGSGSFDFNALFDNDTDYGSVSSDGPNDFRFDPGIDLSADDPIPVEALVDAGDPSTFLDRNGELPGNSNGEGPDVGAVETGP